MSNPFVSDRPCQFCGGSPTGTTDVVPAVVIGARIVHRAISADVCRDCARRLRLGVAGARSNADQVAIRKLLRAERNARRRADQRSRQGSLFEPDYQPQNAILGG